MNAIDGMALPAPAEVEAEPKQAASKRRLPVLPVAALLDVQRSLTAVERFSRAHDEGTHDAPAQAKYYRDLIPLERPKPGQQFAFEVDLDACTGCKACVAGCHSMNGLDENEMWRGVGQLHGGTQEAPALQTITSSCHHCIDPACMNGCPVTAYEKDPVTGIVRHLDDQCFGCQYCTLMCPYDAPKFSPKRGIVRKCDMCADRLDHGEAPACVQACPNEAIAIRIVDRADVVNAGLQQSFLPGAPSPSQTLPSTTYKSARGLPANMQPVDHFATTPEHSHLPLVVMLTLTQLSVGAFAIGAMLDGGSARPTTGTLARIAVATLFGLAGLAASIFHLGRPLLAWRAVLGVRRSWLSREALVFGLYAKLVVLTMVMVALPRAPDFGGKALLERVAADLVPALRGLGAATGIAGVFCSVMVYVATRRAHWAIVPSSVKFFGTTLVLGAASLLATYGFAGDDDGALPAKVALLAGLLGAATAVKLLAEARVLGAAGDADQSTNHRVATLMLGPLRTVTRYRFAAGAFGGLVLPAAMVLGGASPVAFRALAAAAFVLLVSSELSERYLFFRAAPASRMPGGLR